MNISAVLITKNAAPTIGLTLKSLKEFSDVVVLDTGSTDNTIEIARRFANTRIFKAGFAGFGRAKNEAAKLARYDWIFSVDADEVVDYELLNSMLNEPLDKNVVYKCRRYNYYKNKLIKHSGWGKEYVTRLYNRKYTHFNEKLVHESIVSTGISKVLKGGLIHYSYLTIADFSRKRELYSELFSIEYKGKRKSSPLKAFFRATYDFLHTFFIRLGVLDGYRGLLIAVSNANVTFIKYLKLYEANIDYKILINSVMLKSGIPVQPEVAVKQVEAITRKHLDKAIAKVSVNEIESVKKNLTILN